jgi:hypothetical protein
MPMVLHPIDGHYQLIGEAYWTGIIHGDAMTALEDGKKGAQEFQLH